MTTINGKFWQFMPMLIVREGGASSGSSSSGRDSTRTMSYAVPAFPPSHAVDPLFRMPGMFPQGSREA